MKKILTIIFILFSFCSYSQKTNKLLVDSVKSWHSAKVSFLDSMELKKSLRIPTGAVSGYVLTSDDKGNASWVASGGGYSDTTNWLEPVKSFHADTVCNSGDSTYRYIASATSGSFVINHIHECNGTSWSDYTPQVGDAVTVIDSGKVFIFDGSIWKSSGSTQNVYWVKRMVGTKAVLDNVGFSTLSINAPTSTETHHDFIVKGSSHFEGPIEAWGGVNLYTTVQPTIGNTGMVYTMVPGKARPLKFYSGSLPTSIGGSFDFFLKGVRKFKMDSLGLGIGRDPRYKLDVNGVARLGSTIYPSTKGSIGQTLVLINDTTLDWRIGFDSTTFLGTSHTWSKLQNFKTVSISDKTVSTSDSLLVRDGNLVKYRLDYWQRSSGLISPRTATDSIKIPQLASSIPALVEVKSNGLLDTIKTTDITTALIPTIHIRDSLIIDSLTNFQTKSYIGANGTIILPTAKSGWGDVYMDSLGVVVCYAHFNFNSDGSVWLESSGQKSVSTRVYGTNDGNGIAVYDAGNGVAIKNRSTGTKLIKLRVNY